MYILWQEHIQFSRKSIFNILSIVKKSENIAIC